MAKTIVELFLLPPFSLLAASLILLRFRLIKASFLCILIVILLSWGPTLKLLEAPYRFLLPADIPAEIPSNTAIIVPTAGSYIAPDGTEWPTVNSVYRLANAIRINESLHLPIIVTGGSGRPGSPPEASTLITQYPKKAIPADTKIITENHSTNTMENAEAVAVIMKQYGLEHAILSTSTLHGVRAAFALEQAGIDVIGFSPDMILQRSPRILFWGPSLNNLFEARTVLSEYIGIVWYAFSALWK